MTWVTLKLLAAERREVPEGYELVAVPDEDWRTEAGKRCRRPGCTVPSAASFNRGMRVRATLNRPERHADSWWAYCLDHLYGRWIEDDRVMCWVLREKAPIEAGGPRA